MNKTSAVMTGDKHPIQSTPGAIARTANWLLHRLARREPSEERLRLVQRIALSPKQSLTLVEVEGRRLLLATGSDGAPAFYALDALDPFDRFIAHGRSRAAGNADRRISW